MKTAKKLLSILLVVGLVASMFIMPTAAATEKLDTQLVFLSEDGGALTGTIAKDTVIVANWVSDSDHSFTTVQATIAISSDKLEAVFIEDEDSYAFCEIKGISLEANYVTEGVTQANTALLKASGGTSKAKNWAKGKALLSFQLKVVSDSGISAGELSQYVSFEAQNAASNQTVYGVEKCRSYIKDAALYDVVFNVCPYGAAAQKTGEDGLIYNSTKAADVVGKITATSYDTAGAPVAGVTIAGIFKDAAATSALADTDLSGVAFTGSATTATLDVYVKTGDGLVLPVTLTVTKDTISAIAITTEPKLAYNSYDQLSLTDMVVTASWASGADDSVITGGYTVKLGDTAVAEGDTVRYATYNGKALTVVLDEDNTKTATTAGTITVTPITVTSENAATYLDYTAPASLEYTGSAIAAAVAPKTAYADGMTGAITLTYAAPSAAPAATAVNVGPYQVYADIAAGGDFAAASGIYDTTWQFTIVPKALEGATVTVTGEPANGFVYTGEKIEPAIMVSVNDVTVSSDDYDITYPTDAVNVGEKTVSVTFKNNYSGSATGTYTIAAKEVEAELESVTAKAYDGTTAATVTLKIKDADTAVHSGDTLTVSGTAVWTSANAGTATLNVTGITLGGASASNYTLKATELTGVTAPDDVKIAKAAAPTGVALERTIYYKLTTAQTVAPSDFTGMPTDAGNVVFKTDSTPSTVSGEAAAAISADLTNGSFKLVELSDETLVNKTATWTVQLDSDNYATATATVSVTLINKTPVTFLVGGEEVPADGLTAEYTGSAFALNATLKDQTAVSEIKATWYRNDATAPVELTAAPKDVGSYQLKLTYEDEVENNNGVPGYFSEVLIPVTITPKAITVSWTDTALTYTGQAQAPKAEAVGVVSGETLTLTVTGEQTNAGDDYTATASIDNNDNYVLAKTETTRTVKFAIAKAALTVTAKAKTITYGDAPANDGVEYSGFVNGETEAVLTTSGLDYDYTYTQYGNVGAYDITPKGLSAENYAITYVKGTLTVEKKTVGIDWGTLSLPYTGEAQSPAPTATGLVNGDACALTVEGSGTDVGEYTATVTALANDNYKLPTEDLAKTFNITKATSGVTGAAAVNVYHGTADAQTLLITDFVFKAGDETITLAGAALAEDQSDAAALVNTPNGAVTLASPTSFTLDTEKAALDVDKTATWGVKISSTNYADFNATVTLTIIDKEKVDITIAITGDTVYGGQYTVTPSGGQDANGYTVTYSGTPDDGTTFTAGTEAPTKAGSYTVTVKYEDAIAHDVYPGYVGSATAELKIEKATVTVTALNRHVDVGQDEPDLSAPVLGTDYTVEGLVGEDALTGTIAMAYDGTVDTSKTGTYAIKISGGAVPDGNYNAEIVYKEGTLDVSVSNIPETGVTLSKDALTLAVGESETLTATVEPSYATFTSVNWSSSDPSVANVDASGKVTAIKAGTATITATSIGNMKKAECVVTVTGEAAGAETEENVITVKPEVTNGSGAVEIPEAAVKEALENKEAGEALNIVVDTEGAKELETTIPADALKEIAEAGAVVSVQTELGTVNVSPETLKALADQGKDATVTVKANENGSVTVYLGDNAEPTEDTVQIALPEVAPGDVLAIIEPDGTEKIIKKSVTEDGKVYADVPAGTEVKLVNNDKTYADVAATAWYKSAVDFVSSHDLFQGTDKGFEPNLPMSRAMLAMVFCRLEDGKAAGKCPLSDVPENAWYADAAAWVVEAGIMIGTDRGFEPNTNVTRQQMATTLFRYAQYLGMDVSASSSLSTFTDGDKTAAWAKEAMSWAVAVGLFEGDDTGALNPAKDATRAEVAKLFRNMIELIVK